MEIKGSVLSVRYHDDESGFSIGTIETDKDALTFKGTIPNLTQGMNLKLTGDYIIDPKWGRQFIVTSFEEIIPDSLEGIEKYLGSGIIVGLGPATAKKIVKHFGLDTLKIMDEDLGRLSEVKGLGKKKIKLIEESYEKSMEVRNILMFLQPLGITAQQCMKIHLKYGKEAVETIKNNPYALCYDIKSFGFKKADALATKLGVSLDSPERFHAGLMYLLTQKSGQGNTMVPLETLKEESKELLGISDEVFDVYIRDIGISDHNIAIESLMDRVFISLKKLCESEKNVALGILSKLEEIPNDLKINSEKLIEEYEIKNRITLHENQKRAVVEAIKNNILIITGGPGTGKTTIIKCILYLLEKAGEKIALAAPTGRAAKRMKEATGKYASTIHRLLSIKVSEEDEDPFEEDEVEEEILNVNTIIVDEASMIDIILMNNLMKFIKEGTRLILVGDEDQLPSVGPGRVLGDLIESGVVNVVKLSMIYRQGKESMITTNAHRINVGEEPIVNTKGSDFFFLPSENQEKADEFLRDLINNRLPTWNKDWDPVKDIQVLCPMRKRAMGVEETNLSLRKVLNSNFNEQEDSFTEFFLGDKVMQVRNNYNLKGRKTLEKNTLTPEDTNGVFNGDIGYIAKIDEDEKIVTVIFDDYRYVDYSPLDLDDLELAYAITIHKSQGSEFPVVIIPVYFGAPGLMTRNLIYTAVTRGKKLVIIMGSKRALNMMISNVRSTDRFTSLAYRLKNVEDIISSDSNLDGILDDMDFDKFLEDLDK